MRIRRLFSSRLLAHALPGVLIAGGLTGCGDTATLLSGQDTGATPTLTAPVKRLIPTVDIAPARGWPAGGMPTPMAGLTVAPLATGLERSWRREPPPPYAEPAPSRSLCAHVGLCRAVYGCL